MIIYIKSWRTWLFIGYLLCIIYLSITPTSELPFLAHLWKNDKIIHFAEYFILGFLLINLFMIKPVTRNILIFSILFLLLFPLVDEILQYYTPTRIPDIYDCMADICGGFTGFYLRKIL